MKSVFSVDDLMGRNYSDFLSHHIHIDAFSWLILKVKVYTELTENSM